MVLVTLNDLMVRWVTSKPDSQGRTGYHGNPFDWDGWKGGLTI